MIVGMEIYSNASMEGYDAILCHRRWPRAADGQGFHPDFQMVAETEEQGPWKAAHTAPIMGGRAAL